MKRFILAGLVLAFGAVSQAATVTYNPATGVLLYPANFFEINSNLIVAAISGAFPGTGSGNASTNVAQGWSASQTFNGPVFVGSTNLNTHLASKAPLASPAFTGTPTVPTASANSSNTTAATTAYVDRAVAGVSSGGGGNANTNVAQGWSATQVFNAPVTFNDDSTFGDIFANSITPANPFSVVVGGTGGSNASQARVNLGLVPDVDVQAFRLALLQIALAMTSDGHMPVRESGIMTNLASTAAGRALLRAVSATDGRNQLEVGKLHQGAYDRSTWNGVTNETPTLNDISDVLDAMLGGTNVLILSVDTNYFTVSGGQLTLNANAAIPRWIGQFGINSYTNNSTTTNVLFANWTISSNDVPNASGKYLDGAWTMMLTNATGGTCNFHFNLKVDGVVVASVQRSLSSSSTPELHGGRFHFIRESDTSASIVLFGERISATPSVGFGTFGGSGGDNMILATNAACSWSSNVNLTIEIGQILLAGTNSTAAGMQRIHASLYRP
jgi:hypothetical protein